MLLHQKGLGVVKPEAIVFGNSTKIPYLHTGKENCPPPLYNLSENVAPRKGFTLSENVANFFQ
jgi:hypothetical protein